VVLSKVEELTPLSEVERGIQEYAAIPDSSEPPILLLGMMNYDTSSFYEMA
jgi:hypothetical protein